MCHVSEIHEYQKSNSSQFCMIYDAMALKKILVHIITSS